MSHSKNKTSYAYLDSLSFYLCTSVAYIYFCYAYCETHLSIEARLIRVTNFSKLVVSCIADWGKKSAACNGNTECLEQSARQLRQCLDAAFPDSERVELESDKVNYMLSSVFFLANRLSKATQGLAEFDRVMNSIEKVSNASLEQKENQELHAKLRKELDDILAKYF